MDEEKASAPEQVELSHEAEPSADKAVGLALLILSVLTLVATFLTWSWVLLLVGGLLPMASRGAFVGYQPGGFSGMTPQQESTPWLLYLVILVLLSLCVGMCVSAIGVMMSRRLGFAATLVISMMLCPLCPVLGGAIMAYCVLRLNRFLGPAPM